jgi:hypothetical protein
MGGFCNVTKYTPYGNPASIGNIDASASVQDRYSCFVLRNHSATYQDITAVKVGVGTLGTQAVSDTTQLAGTGSGTIESSDTEAFADWPLTGWCLVKTNLGVLKEVVYYASRTDSELTISADGRECLGTTNTAGAATDTLDAIPGIRIAIEAADADGEFQTIANNTTAPTGVSWDTPIDTADYLSIGTMDYNTNAIVWIHRETPANAWMQPYHTNKIELTYTVDGADYTNTVTGQYSIGDTNYGGLYLLYVGEDVAPDLADWSNPAASNATPDFTFATTPPGAGELSYNMTVRQINKYGLLSQNTYYQTITIDSGGADTTQTLTPPEFALTQTTGSGVLLTAKYFPANDAVPAEAFKAYSTTSGVDPDPGVVSPLTFNFTDETYVNFNYLDGSYNLRVKTGYAFGNDVRVLVRTYESTTPNESTNLNPVQIDITTDITGGTAKVNLGVDNTSAIHAPYVSALSFTGTNHVVTLEEGRSLAVTGTDLIYNALCNSEAQGEIHFDGDLEFDDTSITGAQTGSFLLAFDAVSDTDIYLCVNRNRRARINFGTGLFSAASFTFGADLGEMTRAAAVYLTDTETYYQVYDASRAKFVPFMRVNDSGNVAFAFPVKMIRS